MRCQAKPPSCQQIERFFQSDRSAAPENVGASSIARQKKIRFTGSYCSNNWPIVLELDSGIMGTWHSFLPIIWPHNRIAQQTKSTQRSSRNIVMTPAALFLITAVIGPMQLAGGRFAFPIAPASWLAQWATLLLLAGPAILLPAMVSHDRRRRIVQQQPAPDEAASIYADALADTAEALNSTLDPDEVLDRILANLVRVVDHDAANLMLLSEDRNTVRIVRSQHIRLGVGRNSHTAGLVFQIHSFPNLRSMLDTRRPVLIADTATDAQWSQTAEANWIKSSLAAPIVSKSAVIGFITLDSAEQGRFSEVHAQRLQTFCSQAAIAIVNAELFAKASRELAERHKAEEHLVRKLRDM
ncbi:MAG: GAF domain-containing protein, partial [Caldilinea sp.]|nr:GAF domain-containing protein [Caldilinea sp.]